MALDFLPKTSF